MPSRPWAISSDSDPSAHEIVAIVVLQQVDAPLGEQPRVAIFVTERGLATRTRLGPRRAVDAELEAERVDLVAERSHAGREGFRVGTQVALLVTAEQLPAVVDVHMVVAEISEAC